MQMLFENTRYSKIKKKRGGAKNDIKDLLKDVGDDKHEKQLLELLNKIKGELSGLNQFYYKNIEGDNIIKKEDSDDGISIIDNKDKLFKKLKSSDGITYYVTRSSENIEEFKSKIKKYKTKTKDKFVIITDDISKYEESDNIIVLDISNSTSALAAYDIVDNFQDPANAETFSYIFLYGVLDKKGIYDKYKGEIALVLSRLISVILKGHTKTGGLSPELNISAISLMWKNLGLNTQEDLPDPVNFYGKTGEKLYSAFTDKIFNEARKGGVDNIVSGMRTALIAELKKKPPPTTPSSGNPSSGSQPPPPPPNDGAIKKFLTTISGADTVEKLLNAYESGGKVIITKEPTENYDNVDYIKTAKAEKKFFEKFTYNGNKLEEGNVRKALTEYIKFVKTNHNAAYFIPYNNKALVGNVMKTV